MIDSLGSALTDLVNIGLDALTARQQILAHNIANVTTPGYVRKDLDFAAVMRDAVLGDQSQRGDAVGDSSRARLADDIQSGGYVTQTDAGGVELDTELAAMTANVIHYQAIIAANGKRSAMLRMAINGGRS